MFGLGVGEIIVILVIALIFIGPKKLPELARGLGKGMREFQNAARGLTDAVKNPVDEVKNSVLDQPVEDDHSVAHEDEHHPLPEDEDPDYFHQHGTDEEAAALNVHDDTHIEPEANVVADSDHVEEVDLPPKSEKKS